MNKNKKNIFITGINSGIGNACALLFNEYGYNVTGIYYKNNVINNKLKKNLIYKCDVANFFQINNIIKNIENNIGDIDILINNSAISQQKTFDTITENDWDRMFDVNIKGIFNTCKAIVPSMIKNKFGIIINISSVHGIYGASCEVHYSTTKAAIIGFTKSLSKELGLSNIRVNCIAPGLIETNMSSQINIDYKQKMIDNFSIKRLGYPIDIAQLALFLASSKSSFITGEVIEISGGFY